jgi:hypothetical protein
MVRNLKGKMVTPAPDPIAQADIAWFEAHEGRTFRLRDPAPLEFKDPLGDPGDGFSAGAFWWPSWPTAAG